MSCLKFCFLSLYRSASISSLKNEKKVYQLTRVPTYFSSEHRTTWIFCLVWFVLVSFSCQVYYFSFFVGIFHFTWNFKFISIKLHLTMSCDHLNNCSIWCGSTCFSSQYWKVELLLCLFLPDSPGVCQLY
jgi:hypothetical protein